MRTDSWYLGAQTTAMDSGNMHWKDAWTCWSTLDRNAVCVGWVYTIKKHAWFKSRMLLLVYSGHVMPNALQHIRGSSPTAWRHTRPEFETIRPQNFRPWKSRACQFVEARLNAWLWTRRNSVKKTHALSSLIDISKLNEKIVTSFPKMKPPVSTPRFVFACARLRNLTMSSAGMWTGFKPAAPTDMKCSLGFVERSTTGTILKRNTKIILSLRWRKRTKTITHEDTLGFWARSGTCGGKLCDVDATPS